MRRTKFYFSHEMQLKCSVFSFQMKMFNFYSVSKVNFKNRRFFSDHRRKHAASQVQEEFQSLAESVQKESMTILCYPSYMGFTHYNSYYYL